MIPRNIDLTERDDFGEKRLSHPFVLNSINIYDLYTRDAISLGEYEYISRYEDIFEKRYHTNEKGVLFYDEKTYVKKLKYNCTRCGKSIEHFPWKNNAWKNNDLCHTCESIVKKQEQAFPWNANTSNNVPWSRRSRINEVFDLR